MSLILDVDSDGLSELQRLPCINKNPVLPQRRKTNIKCENRQETQGARSISKPCQRLQGIQNPKTWAEHWEGPVMSLHKIIFLCNANCFTGPGSPPMLGLICEMSCVHIGWNWYQWQRISTVTLPRQIGRYVLLISLLISRFDVSSSAASDERDVWTVCLRRSWWIVSLDHPQPRVNNLRAFNKTWNQIASSHYHYNSMVWVWCFIQDLNRKVFVKICFLGFFLEGSLKLLGYQRSFQDTYSTNYRR